MATALSLESSTGTGDTLVLLWGIPLAQLYFKSPFSALAGQNNSSEVFFQMKTLSETTFSLLTDRSPTCFKHSAAGRQLELEQLSAVK